MDATLLVQFWIVAALLAVTPGADWAYAIAAGLRARSVAPSVGGMVFGYTIVISLVALGLGTLVTRMPVALTAVTLVGAAYLVYLGATTLRASGAVEVSVSTAEFGGRPLSEFLRGAGVSGLNPKGIMLLLALLPQFTSPAGAWPTQLQMLTLGGLHLLDCAIVYTLVALLARRVLRSRPGASRFVTRFSGIAMAGIGIALLVERGLELL